MGPRFSEQTWLAFCFFFLSPFAFLCDRPPSHGPLVHLVLCSARSVQGCALLISLRREHRVSARASLSALFRCCVLRVLHQFLNFHFGVCINFAGLKCVYQRGYNGFFVTAVAGCFVEAEALPRRR